MGVRYVAGLRFTPWAPNAVSRGRCPHIQVMVDQRVGGPPPLDVGKAMIAGGSPHHVIGQAGGTVGCASTHEQWSFVSGNLAAGQ